MTIEILWRALLALPALALPGFSLPGFTPSAPTPTDQPNQRQETRAPRATPTPQMPRATPTPQATPAPSATPAPTATGGGELASEQACPGQADVARTGSVLVCLTDYARRHLGKPGIAAESHLMASAAAKAADMKACGYSHTACGRAFNYWISSKGYTGRCSAENIAMGQRTPREVFAAWMKSPGHRANILNASYKDMGVAQLSGDRGNLWVMQLGGCRA